MLLEAGKSGFRHLGYGYFKYTLKKIDTRIMMGLEANASWLMLVFLGDSLNQRNA
jgi:hypothetical protein